MPNKFTGYGFNKLSDEIETVFNRAMKNAITLETERLTAEMEDAVIQETNESVYSYQRVSKSKRRGHSNGGLGDPRNYEVVALFPQGEKHTNNNLMIVFRQKRNILTQGHSWSNEITQIDSSTSLGMSLNFANDLRWVIENKDMENVLIPWNQHNAGSRPYFEKTAQRLMDQVEFDMPQIIGEVAASLRGRIASLGWRHENWN